MRRILAILLLLTFVGSASVGAAPPAQTADQLAITSPGPVSEIWAQTDIIGTANLPNMAYYVVEIASINENLSLPANPSWIPVTGANTQPVTNGVLATLDTTIVDDGLYALRLSAFVTGGQGFQAVVTPLRVNNTRYTQLVQEIEQAVRAGEPVIPTQPGIPPTPSDNKARVTSTVNANVRECDVPDNLRCPRVGSLPIGNSADVLAISDNGSGWYQVSLVNGAIGWIAPNIVTRSGDFTNVPRTAPPPPRYVPPSPTPTPVSTVIVNGIALNPSQPTCGQSFKVNVNLANTGAGISPPGVITIQDIHVGTGQVTATITVNYPALPANSNWVVAVDLVTTVYYNEEHQVRAVNETGQISTNYILQKGTCN